MKKSTYHIICAWVLLLSFIAGQYMVYAHQHFVNKGAHTTVCHSPLKSSQPTVSEKCAVCDSMHHVNMELVSPASYCTVDYADFVFHTFQYNFTSIALILAAGRGPPTA
ncbi:hypothetical protein [Mucilaginibacter glaciei]|uniref:DUF2946 domain-containing protein n=1 Tax=Mucilaginibacter glaciei TaxID=2772109 RepID=A0A926NXP2_9SPHI|nr:hypothetical protein [Mucilaginibacter glaciei]MBD1393733.1 hypothetical protein [Mucilaginibacter glaciei]